MRVAGNPGNRGQDGRIAEVELRGLNLGAGHVDGGGGAVHPARRVIQVLLADRIGRRERFDPPQVGLCGPEFRFLLRERAFRGGQLCLEGFGVHLKHDLPLLDDGALVVQALVQNTVHARAHLDLLGAFGAADELEGDPCIPGLDLDNAHLGRWCRWRFRFAAAGQQQHPAEQRSPSAAADQRGSKKSGIRAHLLFCTKPMSAAGARHRQVYIRSIYRPILS
jgi:hypothetical protein